MATIKCFEDLLAWQKARELNRIVYRTSRTGEFARDRVLCEQIRAATISIMSNIAEGFERDGNKEFIQFLATAKASCGEVRSQLYAALDLDYIDTDAFAGLTNQARETSRLIAGLMHYLRQSGQRGRKYA